MFWWSGVFYEFSVSILCVDCRVLYTDENWSSGFYRINKNWWIGIWKILYDKGQNYL